MPAFALVCVVLASGLLAPGSKAPTSLGGALAIALMGLTLLYLLDGAAIGAFWSIGELVRTFAGASLLGAAAALALAWRWPDVFSPLLAPGLVCGIAVAGGLLAGSALIPAGEGRKRKCRAFLVQGSGHGLGPDDLRRLADRVEIVGRAPFAVSLSSLKAALALHRPHVVLVEGSLAALDFEFLCLCWECGARVLALPCPSYGPVLDGKVVRLGGLPWVRFRPMALAPRHLLAKRALDLGLILLATPFLLGVLAVIAVAVATTSRGSVLYRQVRLGEAGRPFVLLKFRTMHADAERDTGPVLAQPSDPRTTRVGAFLRRSRLDELPQLWNVVRGDMSLVGPRPERPELAARFRHVPEYDYRLLLRPGLTGLAQLVGGYSASAEDKVRCDLLYLSSRSLRLDLRLIGKTALEFLRGFPVV